MNYKIRAKIQKEDEVVNLFKSFSKSSKNRDSKVVDLDTGKSSKGSSIGVLYFSSSKRNEDDNTKTN